MEGNSIVQERCRNINQVAKVAKGRMWNGIDYENVFLKTVNGYDTLKLGGMIMTDIELINLAEQAGYRAAVIPVKDIPVDGSFRKFCEDNLCGRYNANYSCPPGCGTVEQVHHKLFSGDRALVLQSIHEIGSYENKEAILISKKDLNFTIMQMTDLLREEGMNCFCLGYGGCPLCDPCKQVAGEPCVFPEKRISCMSAYCIDVGRLAEKCGLEFAWVPEKLFLFGMIAFHETA